MITQVKIRGDSKVLVLPKDFLNYYGIKVGDWIDLSDCAIISDDLKKIKEEAKNGR